MDLYLNTTVEILAETLKSLGFRVVKKRNYYDAQLWQGVARFHIDFAQIGKEVYCDFHFDHIPHFMFLGVDYKNKPGKFFAEKLGKKLKAKRIKCRVVESTWFKRRNKSILRGFRL